MAPECLQGEEQGAKADVFSFGVLFWEILHERDPDLQAQEGAGRVHVTQFMEKQRQLLCEDNRRLVFDRGEAISGDGICGGGGGGGRDRDAQTDTRRGTERQTDRQRQTNTQRYIETDRQTHTHAQTHTHMILSSPPSSAIPRDVRLLGERCMLASPGERPAFPDAIEALHRVRASSG